jgi:predicted permease
VILAGVLQDIRFGLRTLRKNPGFALAAILTLTLAIGANTTIFSLVNAVLLRGLPGVSRADQLVTLERHLRGDEYTNFSYPDYIDFRDQAKSLSGVIASIRSPLSMSFAGHEPERIIGEMVTGNYFSVLGISSTVGRLLSDDDNTMPGRDPVIVISFSLWQRSFGADPGVIGKTVSINGHGFTIIGVANKDFGGSALTRPMDAWLPLSMVAEAIPRLSQEVLSDRRSHWIQILARMRSDTGFAEARTEVETIGSRQEASYPDMNRGSTTIYKGVGLDSDQRESFKRFLGLLMAAVVCLLLIACANIGGLLMVRAAARRRELAIRLAVGGGRLRIVRQLLTEGMLLSAAGAGLGLLLAPNASSLIPPLRQSVYGLGNVRIDIDVSVLVFTFLLATASTLLFALWPGVQASRADLIAGLKEGTQGAGRQGSLGQKVLVISQVAISLVLLIGAGLTVRTMQKLLNYDKGFESRNVLLMSVDLIIQGYSPNRGRAFYEELMRRTRATPGVASASLTRSVPPDDSPYLEHVFYPGQQPTPAEFRANYDLGLQVDVQNIAPDYFRTMETPILAGREFTDKDLDVSQGVVVISQNLAERLWSGESAIGKRVVIPTGDDVFPPPYEVVGIARDIRSESLLSQPPLVVYHPLSQRYDGRATMVIRTTGDPDSVVRGMRDQVTALDSGLPLFRITTLSDHVAASLWQQQMAEVLIGIFGIVALALTAMGIYGVISQFVAARTHEIGVRMALGATSHSVFKLVAAGGIGLAVSGVVVGVIVAMLLTREMSGLLFGIGARDPITYAAAAVSLALVAAVASYIPARRAMSIEPVEALRYE